jgi:hypothetical protein
MDKGHLAMQMETNILATGRQERSQAMESSTMLMEISSAAAGQMTKRQVKGGLSIAQEMSMRGNGRRTSGMAGESLLQMRQAWPLKATGKRERK